MAETLDEDLLQDFREMAVNGEDDGFTEDERERRVDSLEKLNKTLGWLAQSFDTSMKNKGLVGLGSMDPYEYGELCGIVLERNLPYKWLEKSPEIALIGITAKIAGQNAIALKQLKKQKQEQEQEGEKQKEDE